MRSLHVEQPVEQHWEKARPGPNARLHRELDLPISRRLPTPTSQQDIVSPPLVNLYPLPPPVPPPSFLARAAERAAQHLLRPRSATPHQQRISPPYCLQRRPTPPPPRPGPSGRAMCLPTWRVGGKRCNAK